MFREVTMIELKEVLRLWGKGLPKKRVAAQLGLDPKTVRRYLKAATAAGLRAERDPISDEQVRDVLLALHPVGGRPRGDGWTMCAEQREPDSAIRVPREHLPRRPCGARQDASRPDAHLDHDAGGRDRGPDTADLGLSSPRSS